MLLQCKLQSYSELYTWYNQYFVYLQLWAEHWKWYDGFKSSRFVHIKTIWHMDGVGVVVTRIRVFYWSETERIITRTVCRSSYFFETQVSLPASSCSLSPVLWLGGCYQKCHKTENGTENTCCVCLRSWKDDRMLEKSHSSTYCVELWWYYANATIGLLFWKCNCSLLFFILKTIHQLRQDEFTWTFVQR